MSVIKSLDISNFQRLSRAVIEPTGNVIMLCGKNANGKTSVLDAIQVGWGGHNGREIKRPIKDGHGKATIDITMTDGTVLTRRYTPSGTTLTAKGPDGAKLGQKDLDRMISSLGVDASAFARAGEKDQLKTLLSVVELPFVPAELDAERAEVFTRRRDTNRDVAQLEAQHKAFLPLPADIPEEEVSVTELLAEYRAAQDLERAQADDHQEWSRANAEIDRINAEISRLTGLRAGAEHDLANATARIADHAALPDVDDIQLSIDNAEVINSQVRVAKEKRAVASRLAAATRAAEALTAKLAEIDQRKAEGLAAAEMPVDGLSFDEEGVLYQGVPFSRASGAEQIIVSAAMIIATDPEVRVMVIRNGNVMDEDSLQVLQEMCEDNDFQAFVEFVSDGTDHEFRLVDGELAA